MESHSVFHIVSAGIRVNNNFVFVQVGADPIMCLLPKELTADFGENYVLINSLLVL
jgi:hypothetical protein